MAISAAGAGASYVQSENNAKAQQVMINAGAEAEKLQTQRMYEEINAVSQDQKQQRYADYLVELGRLRTIGSESGLQGATQDRVEAEVSNTAAQDMATLEANRTRQIEQARSQGTAKQMQAGVQMAGIRRPSALGAGLQIGDAAVNYFKPPKQ